MNRCLIVHRGVLPAVALVLCAGTVLAVLAARREGPSQSPVRGAAAVTRIRAEGRVVARPGYEVVLGTERGGRIAALPVREGDRVRRGDLVADLDAADLRAALDEARARVAEAEAEVRFMEAELSRAEDLLQSQAGSSQARDLAERNLDVARARGDSARASVARIEAEIAKTRVVSPIDGVVVARFADPGESVRPLDRVATIADLSQVRVEAEVDEFDAARVNAEVPGLLTAHVLHAAVVAQDKRSRSEASVADLNLTVGGHTITAELLMARATAGCENGPITMSGGSEIVSLQVDGQGVVVSGQPDQTIVLPNERIVINEQSSSSTKDSGEITVNALHVVIDGVADVIVSSAHADIVCRGPDETPVNDFITGGGWITGTPSEKKANFGAAGGPSVLRAALFPVALEFRAGGACASSRGGSA